MSIVGNHCGGCGAEAAMLAVVMDPFSDSCYGLCQTCMAPIFEKRGLRIGDSLAALAEGQEAGQ